MMMTYGCICDVHNKPAWLISWKTSEVTMSVQMIYYASKGNIDKIKQCLNKGVHVDAANCAQETALFHAVLSNRKSCVQFLLKLGANPNRCSKEGFTPVNAACFRDNVKCLALLVRHGADMEKLRNEAEHKAESAMVTAIRHNSSKIIKFINSLKKEALTKEGKDLREQEIRKRKDERKPRNAFPGSSALVPCIKPSNLRRPHDNYVHGNGPNMVLESALWDGSPVTVKRIRGQSKEYVALMLKDADVLSQLRHPQVALLMAVCMGPEYACLVLEPFAFGSLYNLLHRTEVKLDLDSRINIMKGAAEGLKYLHDHQILHCYVNSFSVLISKDFRAKIANLEYSQVNEEQRQPVDACASQGKWMAPEQLRGEPASIATDVYSFGATLWECLSRQVPWSWPVGGSAMEGMSLPIHDMWPQCIKAILLKCLGEEQHSRADNMSAILCCLRCIKNSGELISISDYPDAGFYERFQGNENVFVKPYQTKTMRDDEAISDLSLTEKQNSNIHVMVRRSSLMSEHHKITEARSHRIFGVSHGNKDRCWRQSEMDRYGYKTAEQIACARRIRRHSKNYSRRQWAKEVVVTRYLDGDSKRKSKATGLRGNAYKRRNLKRGRIPPENLQELQIISLKYERKVWARVQLAQQQRARRGLLTDSLEQSEVQLTRCARTLSSQVLEENSRQASRKYRLQDVVSCSSSHRTGQEECIPPGNQSDSKETKNDVRSYKPHTSTVYTSLSWSPVSNGMVEAVERKKNTSRPESDSALYRRRILQSGDDMLRSVSDSKLSLKPRHVGGVQSQHVIPTPAPVSTKQPVKRIEQVFSGKNKMTQGDNIPATSKEEFGLRENELQEWNKLESADLPVKGSNDDVTTSSDYAITTPMFVTTKKNEPK